MVDFLKVIKYEGDTDTLVYKYPHEDFNTESKLIVHQSQEALFFKDGKALDLFGPGKYTLKVENIPILRNIINIPTEGVSPFHCEVYFINKATDLNVSWGTSTGFDVLDPTFGIPLKVGATGTMEYIIEDSRKFVVNIVGTRNRLTVNELSESFKGQITTKVKTYLGTLMNEISYLNINSHLDEVSEALKNKLNEYFKDYGVKLLNFYVNNIIIPEEETRKIKDILNKKLEYGTLNYSWADEQIAEISKKYAGNPGTNDNIGGVFAQIPLAMAFGEMLSQKVGGNISNGFSNNAVAFNPNNNSVFNQQNNTQHNNQNQNNIQQNNMNNNNTRQKRFCNNCGCEIREGSLFCGNCGTRIKEEIKCPNCNADISPEDNFCIKCGYKIK